MNDPRTSPPEEQIVLNEAARVCTPVIDLTRGPGGARDRQLIYGDPVTILNRSDTHSLIRSEKDGFCGWVPTSGTSAPLDPTHKVTARTTQAYALADIKSPDLATLSFGSRVSALSETATFIETELGFIPRQHLHRMDVLADDPAAVAEVFLGTPYLWGGNSFLGIDCSGLVQAACLSCGIACPGDSDQQADALGDLLPADANLKRNDLVFWKGHVAIVRDETTFIHSNAGYMSTVLEPIDETLSRIEKQGDGVPTARKRLSLR